MGVETKSVPIRGHLHALTGIRAVAASVVIVFHLMPDLLTLWPGLSFLTPWMELGYLGVDLFFVLSGFILAWNYAAAFETFPSPSEYATFLSLRLARIYPVHLAVLVAMAPVGAYYYATRDAPPAGMTIEGWLASAALVHAWGFSEGLVWNGPSWSISAEWFAYLCFPAVMVGVGKLSRPTVLWTGWVGTGLLLAVIYRLLGAEDLDWIDGWALYRVGPEFLGGMLLGRLRRQMPVGPPDGGVVVTLAILAGPWLGLPVVAYPPLFGLLIWSLSHEGGVLVRVLSTSAAQYAGAISYAMYMVHLLVFVIVRKLLPPDELADASFLWKISMPVVALLASTALAIATYHLIEELARKRLRKILRPKGR
ncbi:MAG: acyltransferase [Proteobacteria bacterium]|nr:acyltransferase [Pseudomonadota bacterium]